MPVMTRETTAALGERHRDLAHRFVVAPVLRESDRLPRADRSAARDQQRRTRAVAAAFVEELVQDVDLGRGLIECPHGIGRDEALALDERRALPAQELGGNDALQVLIEFLEKSEPATVGFETEPVELLPQRGKSLGKSAFDFGLEEPEPLLPFDGRHCANYIG